jgi:hypothetical protein
VSAAVHTLSRMDTSSEAALDQIDALIADAKGRVQKDGWGRENFHPSGMDSEAMASRLRAAILRFAPPGSAYRQREAEIAEERSHISYRGVSLLGLLMAMRDDIAAGYLQTIAEVLHASLFADFLEMASELQTKGFKDAAAVIAGSVLEEHLRRLAEKNGIDIEREPGKPKKADTLNADLEKTGAYNKLVQKSVTAWLDLRNHAAHGRYDEYDQRQVDALIRDVRDFMVRYPA